MVLGIREYPVDIDADKLIEFIDTNIENKKQMNKHNKHEKRIK